MNRRCQISGRLDSVQLTDYTNVKSKRAFTVVDHSGVQFGLDPLHQDLALDVQHAERAPGPYMASLRSTSGDRTLLGRLGSGGAAATSSSSSIRVTLSSGTPPSCTGRPASMASHSADLTA